MPTTQTTWPVLYMNGLRTKNHVVYTSHRAICVRVDLMNMGVSKRSCIKKQQYFQFHAADLVAEKIPQEPPSFQRANRRSPFRNCSESIDPARSQTYCGGPTACTSPLFDECVDRGNTAERGAGSAMQPLPVGARVRR